MKLTDITHGVVDRPPRIILSGVEKIGKSTFAAGAPAPIFLPIRGEEGIDALDVARFPVCNTLADVVNALSVLATEEHQFRTVVIDSLSTLEPVVWQELCDRENVATIEKVGGGFGKGYIEALKGWRDIMAGLDYLRDEKGMGSLLIAHVVVRTFSDPQGESYDTYELDINKKAVSALLRWSDAILFANCRAITKTEKQGMKEVKKGILRSERTLFTHKRPAHPGGGRGAYGQLPYELELSYDAWENAVEAAKKEGI